jgi:hypothetical protein
MRYTSRLTLLIFLLCTGCARYDAMQNWLGLLALRPSAPWWDRSYGARRSIVISNTGGTLSGVPVLVRLTTSNFTFSRTQSDGSDVCFTSAASEQLAFEKDVYASNDASFWIRTDLPAGDTMVYVYYGSTSSCPSAGSVWDSSYRAVYHLSSDPSSALADSVNSNSLTATAMTAANLTTTTSARGLTFNGTTQFLAAPDSATLRIASDASIEVVYSSNAYTTNAHYLVEKGDSDNDNYALYLKNNGAFGCAAAVGCAAFEFKDSGGTYVDTTGTFSATTGTFHTLSANVNDAGNQIQFFLDGTLAGTHAAGLPGNTWAQPLTIGAQKFGGRNFFFSGTIDEVRISSTLRSADYFAFVHRNVALATTPEIGSEETVPR